MYDADKLARLVVVGVVMLAFLIVVVADVLSATFAPDWPFYAIVGGVVSGVMGVQVWRRNGGGSS